MAHLFANTTDPFRALGRRSSAEARADASQRSAACQQQSGPSASRTGSQSAPVSTFTPALESISAPTARLPKATAPAVRFHGVQEQSTSKSKLRSSELTA